MPFAPGSLSKHELLALYRQALEAIFYLDCEAQRASTFSSQARKSWISGRQTEWPIGYSCQSTV